MSRSAKRTNPERATQTATAEAEAATRVDTDFCRQVDGWLPGVHSAYGAVSKCAFPLGSAAGLPAARTKP